MSGPVAGPPPGWYHDGRQQRWWDGAAWGPAAPGGPGPQTDEQRGALAATFANLGILMMWFVLPLIIRFAEKDNPFVKHHATEALNFQILFGIIWNAALLPDILSGTGAPGAKFVIGTSVAFSAFVANVVFSVIAAVRAHRGEWYRYPINLRLVRGAMVIPKDASGRRIRPTTD